jgi:hypothetical protein
MSYDLAIARGDPTLDEAEREPLDEEAVRLFLTGVADLEDCGDEFVRQGPHLTATFSVLRSHARLREVGVTVQSGTGTRDEVRSEFRQVAALAFELADRLDAAVIDTGIGRRIGSVAEAVDLYAGSGGARLVRPSPPSVRFPELNELPRDEAERRYRAYRDAAPTALAWLEQAVGGAFALDFSLDSLLHAWPWALARARRATEPLADDADTPPWMFERATALAPETLTLADALSHYLGETLVRSVPGARWELGHDPAPHWSEENRPIVAGIGIPFSPPFMVALALRRALEQPGEPAALPRDHPRALSELVATRL